MSVRYVVAFVGFCDLCGEIASPAIRALGEEAHVDVTSHVNVQHSDKGGNDT